MVMVMVMKVDGHGDGLWVMVGWTKEGDQGQKPTLQSPAG
jgi:hypothetical protein